MHEENEALPEHSVLSAPRNKEVSNVPVKIKARFDKNGNIIKVSHEQKHASQPSKQKQGCTNVRPSLRPPKRRNAQTISELQSYTSRRKRKAENRQASTMFRDGFRFDKNGKLHVTINTMDNSPLR